MISHYERIDVYIELLTEDWGDPLSSSLRDGRWTGAGVTPCKEVSGLIFVIIINNPLSSHV